MYSVNNKSLKRSDMAITFPETPTPLVVVLEHILIIKGLWAEIDLRALGRDIVVSLLRSLNLPEISPWHKMVIAEEYQVLEMIHFLDFTVQLLQDLHRPKVHCLHNQMMIQICKINSRMYKIGATEYSQIGEAVTLSILEQLSRDNYSASSECIWNEFYSTLAQLMVAHSREPKLDFIRIRQFNSTHFNIQGLSPECLRSSSNVSNLTELSRLSLVAGDDNSSDGSVSLDTTAKDLILNSESTATLLELNDDYNSNEMLLAINTVNSRLNIRRTNTNLTGSYDDSTDNMNNSIDEGQSIFSNVIDEEQADIEEEVPAAEEEDDDSFDYLNSFTEEQSKSKKNKYNKKEMKSAPRPDLRLKQTNNPIVRTETRNSLMRKASYLTENKLDTRTLRRFSSTISMQPSLTLATTASSNSTATTSKRRLSMNMVRQSLDLRRIPSTQPTINEDQVSISSKSKSSKECVIV